MHSSEKFVMRAARWRRVVLAGAVASVGGQAVFADLVTSSWLGTTNSSWQNASRWDPAVVPNDTIADQFNVTVNGSTVDVRDDVTIKTLTVNSTVRVFSDQTFTATDGISVNGRMDLFANSLLIVDGVLGGTGRIVPTGGGRVTSGSGPLTIGSSLSIGNESDFVGGTIGDLTRDTLNNGSVVWGNGEALQLRGMNLINSGSFSSTRAFATNSGGIRATIEGSFSNSGLMFASKAPIVVNAASIQNSGSIRAELSSQIYLTAASITNSGSIIVNPGGSVWLNGPWSSSGSIQVNDGSIGLGGALTASSLSHVSFLPAGGTVVLIGTYANSSSNFALNSLSPDFRLLGGAISGGSLTTADGRSLHVGAGSGINIGTSILDNVAINGSVSVSKGTLMITNSAQINSAGQVSVSDGVFASTVPLEIGQHFTVRGVGSAPSEIGSLTHPLTNRGLIVAEIRDPNSWPVPLTIRGSSVLNLGTIVADDSIVAFDGLYTREDLGDLQVVGDGFFVLDGTLDNAGRVLETGPGMVSWVLAGTINGGSVSISPGGRFSTNYGNSFFAGVQHLNAVQIFGQFGVGQCTTVVLDDGLLQGSGEYTVYPPAIEGPARLLSGASSLTVGHGMIVRGVGDAFGGMTSSMGQTGKPILNKGSIIAEGDFEVIGSTITNDGSMGAKRRGLLKVSGNLQVVNAGHLFAELDPVDPGVIAITGNLNLSSQLDFLDLSLTSGGVPVTIITFTGIRTGVFNQITPGYAVTYLPNVILAANIPEPGVCTPLCACGTLLLRRRRPGGLV